MMPPRVGRVNAVLGGGGPWWFFIVIEGYRIGLRSRHSVHWFL